MIAVPRSAPTGDFGQDRRTPLLRVLEGFEDENPRAFPHDETVPILVERAAGHFWRVVIRCRQSLD